MDYIDWELLRQQKLWTALTAGKAERTETAEPVLPEPDRPGAEGEESPAAFSAQARTLARRLARRSALLSGEDPAAQTPRGDPENFSGAQTPPAAGPSDGEPSPAERVRTVRTPAPAPELLRSAAGLSDVLERDARRYDGGFSLYE